MLHLVCDPEDANITMYPDYDGAAGGIAAYNYNGDDWVMRVDYLLSQTNPVLITWATAFVGQSSQSSNSVTYDLSGLTLEPADP